MVQDELYVITCYADDAQDLLELFRLNNITPSIIGSTLRICIYTAQLNGEMRIYLKLKFPHINIGPAKFLKGKI